MEIARHLDPRSLLHLSQAHQHFTPFICDKLIWEQVVLCDNWVYHNNTFLFMHRFSDKIKKVTYKHTQVCNPCLTTFPEAALKHMANLTCLNVSSPCFSRPYFLRYTPQVEVLRFSHCPLLDMDIFVQCVSHTKLKKLRVLDLTRVPTVTSLHVWSITYACKNLRELHSVNRMSSFFGEQIMLNCPQLEFLDCLPLLSKEQEWRTFGLHNDIQLGPRMCEALHM